jgi:hypothetical protein
MHAACATSPAAPGDARRADLHRNREGGVPPARRPHFSRTKRLHHLQPRIRSSAVSFPLSSHLGVERRSCLCRVASGSERLLAGLRRKLVGGLSGGPRSDSQRRTTCFVDFWLATWDGQCSALLYFSFFSGVVAYGVRSSAISAGTRALHVSSGSSDKESARTRRAELSKSKSKTGT